MAHLLLPLRIFPLSPSSAILWSLPFSWRVLVRTRFALLSVIASVILAVLFLAWPDRPASAAGTPQAASSNLVRRSFQPQILAKEREELDSLKSGNLEQFAGLLAENAVFVDAHGPATKAEVVKNTAEFRLLDYSIEDVRFIPVSAAAGLIAYKITESGVSHGRQFSAVVYVSALWTNRGGKWVCVFSQETAAK
ncbi:MAG TPA: nuclear transport factor 2 family protein [Candidatus Acidoferrales bacterium]|nr:nuclear transport factor 2 family protein [Candidatus Acidoferrales bacterium]